MSEKLPTVTGKQLIAVLATKGWYVKRIKGSHHILRHPELPDAIPIPVHAHHPLKRGTLLGILRAAGLDREELRRLL